MRLRRMVWCIAIALFAGPVRAEEGASAVADAVREVCGRVGPHLGTEFVPLPGAAHAFGAALSRGLTSCDRLDVEVHLRDGGSIEVLAYPRTGGERLDARKAADRPGLARCLAESNAGIAPYAWAEQTEGTLHARCLVPWGGAPAAQELERALLAAPRIDACMPRILGAFRPAPTEEELTERLREASAADEARRNAILAGIAPFLPEVAVSATKGQSAFGKVVMNRRGAAFDAFRFRVPAEGGERRLVWAFAYPPGTAKGWYIAPVTGDAPKFVKFHRGKRYEGTGVPAEHATLLQRSETALRPGAEYVIWFQFKVDTPVDMYVALGCHPFAGSDRDTPAVLEEALGLRPER